MLPALLLLLQTAPAASQSIAIPTDPQERLSQCIALATTSAKLGEAAATRWRSEGGGYRAKQCLGVAYANQERWDAAASAFEDSAHDSESSKGARSADIWAQAGNAWLAAGDAAKARHALDAALVTGTLTGQPLGEVHLDRARARMASGDAEGARQDIDRALSEAGEDPLVWLLSASLARHDNDMKRAKSDIDEALRRSPDDARVQLEAGSIAARLNDEPGARAAWEQAIKLAPGSDIAEKARNALAQFGTEQ
jgi:tetratricopeptide (TPR) repeat protein